MTPQRWRRLRALFDELAELTAQDRTARIANEHLDPQLHDELVGLLAAHDNSAPIFERELPGHRINGPGRMPH